MLSQCPLCLKEVPLRLLERHVNRCLDERDGPASIATSMSTPVSAADPTVLRPIGAPTSKRRKVDRSKRMPSLTQSLIQEKLCRTIKTEIVQSLAEPSNVPHSELSDDIEKDEMLEQSTVQGGGNDTLIPRMDTCTRDADAILKSRAEPSSNFSSKLVTGDHSSKDTSEKSFNTLVNEGDDVGVKPQGDDVNIQPQSDDVSVQPLGDINVQPLGDINVQPLGDEINLHPRDNIGLITLNDNSSHIQQENHSEGSGREGDTEGGTKSHGKTHHSVPPENVGTSRLTGLEHTSGPTHAFSISEILSQAPSRPTGTPDPSQASLKSGKISIPPQSDILKNSRELNELRRASHLPLAQQMRPRLLNDFHGQDALLGPNGLLRNLIKTDDIPSFVLWGGPGVGKTLLARIIAQETSARFIELSGADSNAKHLRAVFEQAHNELALTGRKTILFLDEIHRYNKAVQDLLLPVLEQGQITVIGATTENPSFHLNNALLSRMHTFTLEPLGTELIVKILVRALNHVNRIRKQLRHLHYMSFGRDAFDYVAGLAQGDSRTALNVLDSVNAYLLAPEFAECGNGKHGSIKVLAPQLKGLLRSRAFHRQYDRHGDAHYDTISAFHKSIRGSDANAAIFYLAKMIVAGEDPLFIARRLVVIASEDIGMRDWTCLPFAVATKDAIQFVGMPEGEIVLAHCTLKMARAPKSTLSYRALNNAKAFLSENTDAAKAPVPLHLRNAPTSLMKDLGYGDSYRYNPHFENGKVKQNYLPAEVADAKFVEKTHLGTKRDEKVSAQDYENRALLERQYQAFKEANAKSKHRDSMHHPHDDSSFPYDENLSKEDQPLYFDGEEKDQYSDDPDCTHNFDSQYDEFHDPESQEFH